MKRRQGIAQREAASRTSAQGWQNEADVLAALKTLEGEPLPPIRPVTTDAPGIRRAFQLAYASHPVYAAAVEWRMTEHRNEGGVAEHGSPLGQALTYLSVRAMHRWAADHHAAPAAPDDDDEPVPF